MTAQTALARFLRSYRALGGDIGEMIDAMSLLICQIQIELKKRATEDR